jgi:hypothetical protein
LGGWGLVGVYVKEAAPNLFPDQIGRVQTIGLAGAAVAGKATAVSQPQNLRRQTGFTQARLPHQADNLGRARSRQVEFLGNRG